MTVVDDVKARLDIVDVVSGYVTLTKAGRNFKANCPFHNERTPSFIVNPERQSWHCFGACATGGDAFTFVMRREGLEFGDTLRLLAQKAGVEITTQSKVESDRRDVLQRINKLAATFYQEQLAGSQGADARDYLKGRGVDKTTAEKFQLGFSPNGWDGLKNYLKGLDASEEDAVQAGLIYRNDKGSTWDFFRGRLMFPIHDRQGRVTGFGARLMDGTPVSDEGYNPKYINTSATPIFDKRNTLYALHLANDAIRKSNTGIIVEGYMDVIAAHQFGYTNVVASMGTALTENQVALLKSLATNFVLALDPDTAGQEATLRSLESSWRVLGNQMAAARDRSLGVLYQRDAVTLKIAALPDGRDPDELIRHDPREWERLTEKAEPLMDYLIPAIASRFDTSTGQGKTQVVETIFPLIAAQDAFDQDRYLRMLAGAIGVTPEALMASLPSPQASRRRRTNTAPKGNSPEISTATLTASPEAALEDYTMALLLQRPGLTEFKEMMAGFSLDHFRSAEHREILARWLQTSSVDEIRAALDESLHARLEFLVQTEITPADHLASERALDQCLRRLQQRHLKELQEALLETEDESTPPSRDLEGEIADVNAAIKLAE
ncbi:MAG: DNA primase [Chloroflexi bacterium]|nr:DNA primase [Chloroflexota bacterium]MCI0840423.1 DNA primase [Chloroflexota bacterium]MCI0869545.1 DNA primase [Chloroflexota bacterium]